MEEKTTLCTCEKSAKGGMDPGRFGNRPGVVDLMTGVGADPIIYFQF